MKTRISTFLLILFLSPASFADGGIAAAFLSKGSQVPSTLLAMGYQQFGALDLTALLNKMPTVNVAYSTKVEALNGNGRLSAHWQGNAVFVDQAWWHKFPDQQPVLALHEYLGSLGFIDDQYWISTAMWVLTLPETETALNSNIKTQIANRIAGLANSHLAKGTELAGGVVGVGGGGEGGTLFVKMTGLMRTLKALSGAQSTEAHKESLEDLDHYLTSPLTVTWGNPRGKI